MCEVFSSEFQVIRALLENWPEAVSAVLIDGSAGSGKRTLAQRVIASLAHPVQAINLFFLDLVRQEFVDGRTSLRRLVLEALESQRKPRTSSSDSHHSEPDAAENGRTAVFICPDSELYLSRANPEVGPEEGEEAEAGAHHALDVVHPALILDFYDCIRGLGLEALVSAPPSSTRKDGEMSSTPPSVVFLFLFNGNARDEMSPFIYQMFFDLRIRLEGPMERERSLLLDHFMQQALHAREVCGHPHPRLVQELASRSGGILCQGIQELASWAAASLLPLGPVTLTPSNLSSSPIRLTRAQQQSLSIQPQWSGEEASSHPEEQLTVLDEGCAVASSLCCEGALQQFFKANSAAAALAKATPGFVDVQKTRWHDIAGLTSVKAALQRLVTLPTQQRALYAEHGVRPSVGVLLFGPPGTGKTMLAKAMATELNASFVYLDLPQLIHAEVGESERILTDFFASAKRRSPCLLFIDELQAAFGIRKNSSHHEARLVSLLLSELDAAQEDTEHVLLFVGATNVKHKLDPMLLRPGRLDVHIEIPLPDDAARAALVDHMVLGRWACWFETTLKEESPAAVDMQASQKLLCETFVQLSQGMSGAELDNAMNLFSLHFLGAIMQSRAGDADGGISAPLGMYIMQQNGEDRRLSTEATHAIQRTFMLRGSSEKG